MRTERSRSAVVASACSSPRRDESSVRSGQSPVNRSGMSDPGATSRSQGGAQPNSACAGVADQHVWSAASVFLGTVCGDLLSACVCSTCKVARARAAPTLCFRDRDVSRTNRCMSMPCACQCSCPDQGASGVRRCDLDLGSSTFNGFLRWHVVGATGDGDVAAVPLSPLGEPDEVLVQLLRDPGGAVLDFRWHGRVDGALESFSRRGARCRRGCVRGRR